MDLKHASRPPLASFIARRSCLKVTGAALTAAVVAALVVAQAVVADDCPSFPHGNSISDAVPCQNATCAAWADGVPGKPVPTCSNPSGLTIITVTVKATATAWSNCVTSSSKTSCNETPTTCASYWMYGDNGCTVLCKNASIPEYCKGP